jgi:hypothetical protein
MKWKIATLIFGILLIGVVSSALVPYLSNTVTGSVTVEGPVFYLDLTNILNSDNWGYLKLNNANVNGAEFILNSKKFFSDSLGVDNFYPLDFEITLNAKAHNLPNIIITNPDNSTTEAIDPCAIDATVYQTSSSGSYKKTLCNFVITDIDNEDVYNKYDFLCKVFENGELSFNPNDRIELSLTQQCPSQSDAYIELNGNSYMQIVPKVTI